MAGQGKRNLRRFGRQMLQQSVGIFLGGLGIFTGVVEMLREKEERIDKILVIRLDLLGDLVLSMPAVRVLKETFPEARLDMLVLPYTRPLLDLYPEVEKTFEFDINKLRPSGDILNPAQWRKFFGLIGKLRKEKYDLCVSLHGHPASAIALLSGARLRVGYDGDSYPYSQNIPVPGKRYRIRKHEAEYSLALIKAVGASSKNTSLSLLPRAEDVDEMKRVLLRYEGVSEGPRIAVHVGATNGAAKRWILESWSVLLDRLIEEKKATVILTGSPSELQVAEQVMSGMKNQPVVMTGKTSIPQLVALVSLCDLMISGDSGPLHIAVAAGVPSMAIHGPTDPLLSGPYGGNVRIIRKNLPCSPCYDLSDTADCPKGRPECMEAISVEEVHAAVEEMLGSVDIAEGRNL